MSRPDEVSETHFYVLFSPLDGGTHRPDATSPAHPNVGWTGPGRLECQPGRLLVRT
ncbi:hypothetical protein FP2506_14569 [Fulvimarina pelagi HTCC2506]|uniref:Uncharacterized protein n=1 Tax=Fulvimarina pelagi HTCC2506 TaxID=314231 RepID=Q0G416_9HYPH|nr:hypothetical protein FP2506_14569 [Fulvimarina pelagi HTCC2506]